MRDSRRSLAAAAVRTLWTDQVSAEVATALADAGIPTLLLKGPALTRRLYEDGPPREYRDSDLLAPRASHPSAERTLRALDFKLLFDQRADRGAHAAPHADTWTRQSDRAVVDLHWSLPGVEAPPEVVWDVFVSAASTLQLGNAEVWVPRTEALAFHVALHAAQHGLRAVRPMEDLRRAIEQLDGSVWASASSIASTLEAVPAFAAGLRLHADGAILAWRLGLPRVQTVRLALATRSAPSAQLSVERFAATRGFERRLRFVRAKVFPSPAFMQFWSPFRRWLGMGLILAYAVRPVWVGLRAPGAPWGWHAARREVRRKLVAEDAHAAS